MASNNTTPRGIPKRLFESNINLTTSVVPLGGILMKKNESVSNSGDESDLGPMSPLALTDQSPSSLDCDSSPEKESIPINKTQPKSPFSTLRKITHAARYSPRCRLFETTTVTQREKSILNEVIPETPEKIEDTPKGPNFELISPCIMVDRETIPIPKLHRRKSNTVQDENLSPEPKKNTLKRPANDSLEISLTKLLKSDEYTSIPKARAALFKETTDKVESQLKNFSLSTRMFYNSNNTAKKPMVVSNDKINVEPAKIKKNLPPRNPKQTTKRTKHGGMNAGVSHRIKKPKLKHARNSINEKENSPIVTKKLKESPQSQDVSKEKKVLIENPKPNLSFDAADLNVDEPDEIILEKNKVNDLLKILEDDWSDDDENNDAIVNSNSLINSFPKEKKKVSFDVLMSPASELSNMTLTMNLKDNSSNEKHNQDKYYPIFDKGYSAQNSQEDIKKVKGPSKSYTKWQLSKFNDENDQYQLDVGQKKLGATQCTECQVVYQIGDPEDENVHLNYHNSIKLLKFNGWKTERVIEEDPFTSSRIILVEPNDPKQCWKKVSEILDVVDRELGLADMKLSCYYDKKVYLYIKEKKIVGVLVAEPIKSAYRMIPDLIEMDCCTAESTPAKCGINVVWTVVTHRNQGIATKMVDVLRKKYFYGYIMSLDDIAFSMPTPSGKMFAIKYTKTKNFQVYN